MALLETGNMNCYEYLRYNVQRYGEYDAVEHFGKRTSLAKFLWDVDCLASYFSKTLQVKRGEVYTILLPTSVQSLVAFYALNKIGAISNFIHPLSAPNFVQEMMEDTKSRGIMIMDVLADKYIDTIKRLELPSVICSLSDYAARGRKEAVKLFSNLKGGAVRKLKRWTTFEKALQGQRPSKGLSGNAQDDAVYLCGGGTTGKSKTIRLSSKNINEEVFKLNDTVSCDAPGEGAMIAVLPLFHAYGLALSMHLPLCHGARVIPMSKFNAKRFNQVMHINKINLIAGIPAMFQKIMREDNFDGPHLKHLHVLSCGGDTVSEQVISEFNAHLEKWGASGRLLRGYGLTEVSSACSGNRVYDLRENSIGKPLYEIRMEIWDENKQPLPPGEKGEIVVSGTTVMKGYFTKDGREKEGLYIDENGVEWVLTGDIGYQDEDGYFYFSARKKRLIIISGYNVYPGDVESLAETKNFVREACAVQGYTKEKKPIVRLYLSLGIDLDHELCKKELMELFEAELPAYSVPREIVIMDALPRTAMQKLDFMSLTETL